jgi:recombinational DNA repair protein (RecF pathway)
MVATILAKDGVHTYYRFFGARHSILQFGHLVDFEVEGEGESYLPRMRQLSHIGFPWLYDNKRLLQWHNYLKLFEPHLRDTETLEPFYFELLLDAAKKWSKQNPKRIVCENAVALLRHEGRLHDEEHCYICENPIGDEVALMQAYIPAHPACIQSPGLRKEKLHYFFESGKSLYLDDGEVEYLYRLAMRGL